MRRDSFGARNLLFTPESTRQEGSTTMVEDDFQLLCFDLVSEPSTSGAYLVAEGKVNTHLTKADRINRALNDVLGD